MKKFILLLLISFSASVYSYEYGDPVKGKIKAPSCIFCHGETGKASNSAYPNLDMQNEMYLYLSMKSYQNDERKGPLAQMMKAQLQRLNDQDLRDIAAFYANSSKSENK
ncbi:c-type cytochrome [Aliivibrio fischeri]|uniref:c-type cytochrome n=1 Tax=Aliivibrio fischeri TaxID=668 RepID=UPI0012D9BA9C|nr:cytochrome c [Aliivibrio fischeri]MUI54522.1 c-type cytochrome [Aliivibrio fischeri]MUJ36555.1 c-type cytochrome [Aliivibrio fischeri]